MVNEWHYSIDRYFQMFLKCIFINFEMEQLIGKWCDNRKINHIFNTTIYLVDENEWN